jgi:4-hydroxy-tetrahydrodipicolinate reductase
MSMKSEPLRLTFIGAAGRMGLELARALPDSKAFRIHGAVVSPGSAQIDRDLGELAGVRALGVRTTSNLSKAIEGCDVVIEAARATSTLENLAACRAARKPFIILTSGLEADFEKKFDEAARDIPLLLATNASLGATLLFELVREAVSKLPKRFEVEISEAHDNKKEDAPSGTAMNLGRLVASIRGQDFAKVAVTGSRAGKRRDGDIGYSVIRAAGIVDEHTVLFVDPGEHLQLTHRAIDYDIFVQGTLEAAKWLVKQPPGRYRMRDVIGFK